MFRNNLQHYLGLVAVALIAVPLSAQDAPVVGSSVSTARGDATLTFFLNGGERLQIRLRNGAVRIGDAVVGRYAPNGAFEQAWRGFLDQSVSLSTGDLVALARAWDPGSLPEGDAETAAVVLERLAALQAMEVAPVPAVPAVPDVPVLAGTDVIKRDAEGVAPAARDAADAARAIRDEVRSSIRDNIRRGIQGGSGQGFTVVTDDFGYVQAATPVEAIWHGLLGIFGAFLALTGVAFGTSFFAERQLDIMADTVQASFGRSFFVGLFAQPLILPVFAMMLVGLAMTVVGIIVIPVAIIAFAATLAAAVIGGYLAVARVAGAKFLSRKGQDYGARGAGMLRSLMYGSAILLAIWLPAVVLGWTPVASTILFWTAVLMTWGLATTGFGAAILTRGGLRGTFGQRFVPASAAPGAVFAEPAVEVPTDVNTAEWLAQGPD